MIGYLMAVISSIFFSLYIVPRKLSNLRPVIFSFFMATGFFLSSVILYLFQPLIKFKETVSLILLWSAGAGIIWSSSFVCFIRSIDLIGLSRSNQWKNLQGPVGVILSLIILKEILETNPLFVILAAAAIFLSAFFFTKTSKENKEINIKGIYLASLAAIGFGAVATIQKYVTVNVGIYSQQVIFSFSIAASLFIYIILGKKTSAIIKSSKKDLALGLFTGIFYLGASMFQLLSYYYLPVSIGFTIIQLNAFWTITIGIVFFKEIKVKKYFKEVILGLLFTFIGIMFLSLAKR